MIELEQSIHNHVPCTSCTRHDINTMFGLSVRIDMKDLNEDAFKRVFSCLLFQNTVIPEKQRNCTKTQRQLLTMKRTETVHVIDNVWFQNVSKEQGEMCNTTTTFVFEQNLFSSTWFFTISILLLLLNVSN